MDTGDSGPDFIQKSMMNAIASYVVAFVRREGMTPDQATTLLGITKAQLLELVQANTASFDLDEMVTVLSSIGQYVSVCGSSPLGTFAEQQACPKEPD